MSNAGVPQVPEAGFTLRRAGVYLVICLIAAAYLVPLVVVVLNSLRTAAEIAQTLELVRLKRIKPVVTQIFSLDRVEEAHELIRRNATAGRLALEISR